MAVPHVYGIEFVSKAGRELLATLAAKHGAAIAAFANAPDRIFGFISPLAPEMRFVGAQLRPHSAPGALIEGPGFSLSGAALTLDGALASCLGEGVERLSQVERTGDIGFAAPILSGARNVSSQTAKLIEQVAAASPVPYAADHPIDWIAATDFITGREVTIPADWCLRRAMDGPQRMPDTALSTGVAAGATWEAAAARSILELVERDAAALWWVGGRRGRPIGLGSAELGEATRLVERIRDGEASRSSWLLDITTDLEIPCAVALSVDPEGTALACGMAARPTMMEAVSAALTEMFQMELALLVVELKRRQRGDGALNAVDLLHLARATGLDAGTCDLLHPLGTPRRATSSAAIGPDETLGWLRATFANASIDLATIDLTRDDFGIPVVAAIAPALQRLPCGLQTERLRAMIAKTGGGRRWTGNVALL